MGRGKPQMMIGLRNILNNNHMLVLIYDPIFGSRYIVVPIVPNAK